MADTRSGLPSIWGDVLRPIFEGLGAMASPRSVIREGYSFPEGDPFKPARGQLTFDLEGVEDPGSIYFSRKAHVPGEWSGVTIGRGYDLSQRSAGEIRSDLTGAGFADWAVELAVSARGKRGEQAQQYLEQVQFPIIEPEQQRALFEISYEAKESYTADLLNRPWNVRDYGPVEMAEIPAPLWEGLVDLVFRGDYGPPKQALIHPLLSAGDYVGVQDLFSDRDMWAAVPYSRFEQRRLHVAGE